MKKYVAIIACMAALAACSKHDPILPGTRTAIFGSTDVTVLNTRIDNLPATALAVEYADCPYTQDSTNVIRSGDKRIFSGFPTGNSVRGDMKPVCVGGYVYAGLTTGELVKVNPKNRKVMWVADIYRDSNMTGGASVLDIVAPMTVTGNTVYVGGLGDAFCRINAETGSKKWCANVGTAVPHIIAGDTIFVVGTDSNVYALRASDGAAYWKTGVKKAAAPTYDDKILTVGRQKIDAATGEIIKQ